MRRRRYRTGSSKIRNQVCFSTRVQVNRWGNSGLPRVNTIVIALPRMLCIFPLRRAARYSHTRDCINDGRQRYAPTTIFPSFRVTAGLPSSGSSWHRRADARLVTWVRQVSRRLRWTPSYLTFECQRHYVLLHMRRQEQIVNMEKKNIVKRNNNQQTRHSVLS